MSSSIWMQCAGSSELRPLQLTPWRVVEAQHEVSTRKLVNSASEQELLEELLEAVKPPAPATGRMHYLLFTPFRYPPLRHGSRFGTRHEPGIWYGSEQLRTAFAEVAYYRLLFLEGTHATLGLVTTSLTAFTVRMRSGRGVDLTDAPFDMYRDMISSPEHYGESQVLGQAMREAGVELFRYASARDGEGRDDFGTELSTSSGAFSKTEVVTNVGAFTPAVFHGASPQHFQRWHCAATRELVGFTRGDLTGVRETHEFSRAQFLVGERLPSPAV